MRQCDKCKTYMREGIYDETNVEYFCTEECYSKATGGLEPDGEEVYFTTWEETFKFVIIEQRTDHKLKRFFVVHPQLLYEYPLYIEEPPSLTFFASFTADNYTKVIEYLEPILSEIIVGYIGFLLFYSSSSSSVLDNINIINNNSFVESNETDLTYFNKFVSVNANRLKGVKL